MDDDVRCARCQQPVDVWSYGKGVVFWFLAGGVVIFLGALTLPIGVGFVLLPMGLLMVFGSPVCALVTRGMRRCRPCKQSWRPGQDGKRALPHPP